MTNIPYNGNYIEGIFFTEKNIEDAELKGKIQAKSRRMNSNLSVLKCSLANQAKAKGANAVVNYKYGQKRKIFSAWDNTIWYAEGDAVLINEDSLEQ